MRRLLTWIVVTLGIAAIVRRLRRRKHDAGQTAIAPPAPAPDDPAEELRQKLAESRTEDEPAEPPTSPAETVDERRAEVHNRGRAALDEMDEPSDES